MYVQRFVVPVVTAADGSATVFTPVFTGRVLGIRYVKDGTTPFDNGSTMTATLEATGESVWSESNVNASASRYPRVATHGITGAASLYAAGGTAVDDHIYAAADRLQIVIASGGNAKNGSFHVIVG